MDEQQKIIKGYKVVRTRDDGQRVSLWTTDPQAEVIYSEESWATAPEELAKHGLYLTFFIERVIAVRYFEDVSWSDRFRRSGHKLELWEVQAENEHPVPLRRFHCDLSLEEWVLLAKENYHMAAPKLPDWTLVGYMGSTPGWPYGTRMAEKIILTKKIRPLFNGW